MAPRRLNPLARQTLEVAVFGAGTLALLQFGRPLFAGLVTVAASATVVSTAVGERG